MIELYKDGEVCLCEPAQLDIMIAAGWSTVAEEAPAAKGKKKEPEA